MLLFLMCVMAGRRKSRIEKRATRSTPEEQHGGDVDSNTGQTTQEASDIFGCACTRTRAQAPEAISGEAENRSIASEASVAELANVGVPTLGKKAEHLPPPVRRVHTGQSILKRAAKRTERASEVLVRARQASIEVGTNLTELERDGTRRTCPSSTAGDGQCVGILCFGDATTEKSEEMEARFSQWQAMEEEDL